MRWMMERVSESPLRKPAGQSGKIGVGPRRMSPIKVTCFLRCFQTSLDFPHSGRALQIHHLMTVKVLAYPTPPLSIMSCRCVIFIAIGAPLALSSGFDWIF